MSGNVICGCHISLLGVFRCEGGPEVDIVASAHLLGSRYDATWRGPGGDIASDAAVDDADVDCIDEKGGLMRILLGEYVSYNLHRPISRDVVGLSKSGNAPGRMLA